MHQMSLTQNLFNQPGSGPLNLNSFAAFLSNDARLPDEPNDAAAATPQSISASSSIKSCRFTAIGSPKKIDAQLLCIQRNELQVLFCQTLEMFTSLVAAGPLLCLKASI